MRTNVCFLFNKNAVSRSGSILRKMSCAPIYNSNVDNMVSIWFFSLQYIFSVELESQHHSLTDTIQCAPISICQTIVCIKPKCRCFWWQFSAHSTLFVCWYKPHATHTNRFFIGSTKTDTPFSFHFLLLKSLVLYFVPELIFDFSIIDNCFRVFKWYILK